MKENIAKLVSVFITITLTMQLCACQKKPNEVVVSSNENGAFVANVGKSAIEEDTSDAVQSVEITDDFYSSDGSVHFMLNLATSAQMSTMPVVEVVPHYLSEEDAERVGGVLFNGAVGYEAQPLLALTYSKPEIQKCLTRWSPYASPEGIKSLFGEEDDFTVDVVKKKIENLTAQYEAAADNDLRQLCNWKFQKEAYYTYAGEEASAAESYLDNDMIIATFEVNGAVYDYTVATRNKNDYKLNDISAYFRTAGSPMSIDAAIYQSKFCRTGRPDEAEISAVKAQAEDMLSRMNLGQWNVDRCEVQVSLEELDEYTIHITAVPVLNNAPALSVPQLTNLKSEAAYASNYYMTMVEFIFSANGDLIFFHMDSPIDVKQVVNENVDVIDLESLVFKAKNHLVLSDASAYIPTYVMSNNEEMICNIDINCFHYGLLRIKVPNSDESYYYVPGIILSGCITAETRDGSKLYYTSESQSALVALNAVDGTIIELTNG